MTSIRTTTPASEVPTIIPIRELFELCGAPVLVVVGPGLKLKLELGIELELEVVVVLGSINWEAFFGLSLRVAGTRLPASQPLLHGLFLQQPRKGGIALLHVYQMLLLKGAAQPWATKMTPLAELKLAGKSADDGHSPLAAAVQGSMSQQPTNLVGESSHM